MPIHDSRTQGWVFCLHCQNVLSHVELGTPRQMGIDLDRDPSLPLLDLCKALNVECLLLISPWLKMAFQRDLERQVRTHVMLPTMAQRWLPCVALREKEHTGDAAPLDQHPIPIPVIDKPRDPCSVLCIPTIPSRGST